MDFKERWTCIALLAWATFLQFVVARRHTALPLPVSQEDVGLHRHFEILDTEKKFVLEWTADWRRRRLFFNATVRTRGYVALGLSAKGDYAGADIVIGGVSRDGRPYFADRHGIREGESRNDVSQDWTLTAAWENNSHTFLSFSRAFDTCDDTDYPVNDFDLVTLLWEYGDDDNPGAFHSGTRGVYPVYLLDPNLAPRSLKEQSFNPGPPPQFILDREGLKLWTISSRVQLPSQDTLYHCSIHRGADIRRKHHVIGFNARFEPEEHQSRAHHIVIFRCTAPQNSTAIEAFERFVGHPGDECYMLALQRGEIPTPQCTFIKFAHAIGGRMLFFPYNFGIPIGETGDQEYFLMQTHFDNPERRRDIDLTVNVDFYYTDDLRPNDGGAMTVGHHVPASPSILLPPDTVEHSIHGHCSPQCTTQMLPAEGIKVAVIALHTHLSGRSVKARHFRNGRELPWILADENYNFNFQQVRPLNMERTILPGDQLTIHCEYDTTWTNGSSVVGGYSTRHEMCMIYMFYHTVLPDYSLCRSEITDGGYMRRYLGVTSAAWDGAKRDVIATAPPSLAGLGLAEISNSVNWTPELRAELERDQTALPQTGACTISPSSATGQEGNAQASVQTHTVRFPDGVVEYTPPHRECLSIY